MKRNFAVWDIEIADPIPLECPRCGKLNVQELDNGEFGCAACLYRGKHSTYKQPNWSKMPNLGISCAALAWRNDGKQVENLVWSNDDRLSPSQMQDMIGTLRRMVMNGYTLVTWNGLSFDWRVLAKESGEYGDCIELSRTHCDLMFQVVATKGWRLKQQVACDGMAIKGKLKSVTLRDGTKLDGMYGGMAPLLWKKGEYAAVLSYLVEDVRSLLELSEAFEKYKYLAWRSRPNQWNPNGKAQSIHGQPLTVAECLDLPLPDQSWMDEPPLREHFIDWWRTNEPTAEPISGDS